MANVALNFIPTLKKLLPQEEVKADFGVVQWYEGIQHPLQFVFRTDEMIIDGRIEVDAPFQKYTLHRVGYVPTTLPIREEHDEYILSDRAGLFPDPLMEVNEKYLHFAPHINHAFYLTFEEENLAEGNYEVKVTVYNKDAVVGSATAQICVSGETLENADVTYFNWIHYDSIAEIHRIEPYTKAYYDVLKSYVQLAKKLGSEVLFVPVITPPLDTHVGGYRRDVQLVDVFYDGKYTFSFDRLGKFLDFAVENGMKRFEFPPFFSQWDAKYAASFMVNVKEGRERRFGWDVSATSPEYVSFLTEFLTALASYLKERGVYGNCYFHVCDEAREESHYNACRDVVKKCLVGGTFIDTRTKITGEENSIDVISLSTVGEYIQKGIYPAAVYYCWGDYKNYVTNRFLCMPLARTAVLWLQMYLNDANVFLHWGFNFYQDYLSYHYIDPYIETSVGGIFPGGDGFIVYPDVAQGKALPSIRFYALAYGRALYRLLKTLEKYTDKEYVKGILAEFGMVGYEKYPHNDEWLYALEKRLLDEIRSRK